MSLNVRITLFVLLGLAVTTVCCILLLEPWASGPGNGASPKKETLTPSEKPGLAARAVPASARKRAHGTADARAGAAGREEKEPIAPEATSEVRVHGRVLDEEGNPLEGVLVEGLLLPRYEKFFSPFGLSNLETAGEGVRTGPDGGYAVTVPAAKLALACLRFHREGYAPGGASLNEALPLGDGSFLLEDLHLEKKDTVPLEVEVVDTKGDPVPGCRVSTRGMPWNEEVLKGAAARTDDRGRCRLDCRPGVTVHVRACREGIGAGWSGAVTLEPGKPAAVKVTLGPWRTLAGRLVDAEGNPAAGMKLWAEGRIDGLHVLRRAETDGEGRFRFEALADTRYEIRCPDLARRVNFGGRTADFTLLERGVPPGTKDLVLFLPAGSCLRILLVDDTGAPVDRAPWGIAFTHRKEGRGHSTTHFHDLQPMKREKPGVFLLEYVPEGAFDVTLEVKGYMAVVVKDVTLPPPAGMAEASAVLHPTGVIHGTVRDPTGAPVEGVLITLGVHAEENGKNRSRIFFNENGIRIRDPSHIDIGGGPGMFRTAPSCVTDRNGAFTFEDLPLERYALFLKVRGLEILKHGPVVLSEKARRAEVEIALPPCTGAIEGTVRDARGRPLPGVFVVAWDGDALFNRTRGDGEGRYTFRNLPDGRYVVDARVITQGTNVNRSSWGWGGGPWSANPDELEALGAYNADVRGGRPCRLDLVVPDPWNSVIDLTVETAPGIPLPRSLSASITEIDPPSGKGRYEPPSKAALFKYSPGNKEERLGPGRFRFRDLRAGTYRVGVSWSSAAGEHRIKRGSFVYSRAVQRWKQEETFLVEPSTTHALRVHLSLASFSASVTDVETGEPVPEAKLVMQPCEGTPQEKGFFTTGPEGTFSVDAVPAGEYSLAVFKEGYLPCVLPPFRLSDGEALQGLDVRLAEGGVRVRGVLHLWEEKWIQSRWSVSARFLLHGVLVDPGSEGAAPVAEDGTFVLNGLPSGPVTLQVFRWGVKKLEKTVTLPLPGEEPLVLEVQE